MDDWYYCKDENKKNIIDLKDDIENKLIDIIYETEIKINKLINTECHGQLCEFKNHRNILLTDRNICDSCLKKGLKESKDEILKFADYIDQKEIYNYKLRLNYYNLEDDSTLQLNIYKPKWFN